MGCLLSPSPLQRYICTLYPPECWTTSPFAGTLHMAEQRPMKRVQKLRHHCIHSLFSAPDLYRHLKRAGYAPTVVFVLVAIYPSIQNATSSTLPSHPSRPFERQNMNPAAQARQSASADNNSPRPLKTTDEQYTSTSSRLHPHQSNRRR